MIILHKYRCIYSLLQSFIVTCSSATWYFILPVAELLSLYGDLQYTTAVTVQDIQVVTLF